MNNPYYKLCIEITRHQLELNSLTVLASLVEKVKLLIGKLNTSPKSLLREDESKYFQFLTLSERRSKGQIQ